MKAQPFPYRIHIRQGDFELDVEGDQTFVESYIGALLAEGEIPEAPPAEAVRERGKVSKARARTGKPGRRNRVAEVRPDDLKAFMKGRRVVGNKDRYLEYMRFWRQKGVRSVSDAHIQRCFEAQGLPVPPTGRQNFGTLRKEGLVRKAGARGLWKLAEEPGAEEKPKKRSAKRRFKALPKKAAPKKKGKRTNTAPAGESAPELKA
jgi:hypothetical protein